jgi:hypothetical protein|tara:strand:+ start:1202 stop:1516 length:315 start_codon:yes stop_codon:yes gene_type:complete
MNNVVLRIAVKARNMLLVGGIAGLIVALALSRAGDGMEGGSVFMLLLFGMLFICLLVLNTKASFESDSSTAGVLSQRSEDVEVETPANEESLPDPIDSGFEIPL